ncbi:hypothetical protein AB0J51_16150 [Micromonospora echinofusca]|uniref:hypothetical protein n=1 Tax=Micromonospora echinofusca TaxID=47858 RepID=UPI003412F0A3
MADMSNDYVLTLVQRALDEIDDRPIDATTRRAARIASLLGETEFAVYLGMELKPAGGHPPANAADTRRLMADPSLWDDPDGPVEAAMTRYLASRAVKSGPDKGKHASHGLGEVESLIQMFSENPPNYEVALSGKLMRDVKDRVKHTVFVALCAWERQLTYANVNERIFDRFRSQVDAMLAQGAPTLLDQFSAVYRRLRAATNDPAAPVAEELSQAVTTCRRILKAVADHVLPGVPGAKTDTGHSLNDAAYRNRVYEYVKTNTPSDTTAATVNAAVGGLIERFTAIDKLANKGVHADVGAPEAELCAIHTYLVAGELLALGRATE